MQGRRAKKNDDWSFGETVCLLLKAVELPTNMSHFSNGTLFGGVGNRDRELLMLKKVAESSTVAELTKLIPACSIC